jgi:hypothetical protein
LPWGIYILEEHLNNKVLVKHELAHARQIKEEGVIKFYLKYLYYTLRYGYKNNPYEIDARRSSLEF